MVPSFLVKKCKSFINLEGLPLPPELHLSTDTRHLDDHNAFICIRGPRFDGHTFIKQAIEKNIRIIFAENAHCVREIKAQNVSLITVNNTIKFMQELASLWSRLWQSYGGTMIGLTGSSGKTTSKEMLAHILKGVLKDKIHHTKNNLNNHIGVPLTIFKLEKHHKFAIVEMGTSHPGEIKYLCEIADPSAGLITNIGPAHLEALKNLEGVFLEKTALFRWIKQNQKKGPLIILNDDPFLSRLKGEDKVIGLGKSGDYLFKREKNCLKIYNSENEYKIFNNYIYGEHNFTNLAQTFLLALRLFPDHCQELKMSASTFKIKDKNRGFWHEISGKRIFLDAYNANPDSFKASLQGLMEKTQSIDKQKILLIIGDMRELGEESEKFHELLGQYVQEQNYHHIAFVGKYAKFFQKGFLDKINIYNDAEELKKDWPKFLTKYEVFFFKGSRSLQLESCLGIKDKEEVPVVAR